MFRVYTKNPKWKVQEKVSREDFKREGGESIALLGATHTPTVRERERERERDDRGRVLRLPLVAPPSLFQPRDGVGFDRYDFDDVNDDDHNTCFLCTPMCFVVLLYVMRDGNWTRGGGGGENVSLFRGVFFRER